MQETTTVERASAIRRGRSLEYFTIVWNTLEGLVAVVSGAIAGSISLVGFGIDSFIEVTSEDVRLFKTAVLACSRSSRRKTDLVRLRILREVGVCFMIDGLHAIDQ